MKKIVFISLLFLCIGCKAKVKNVTMEETVLLQEQNAYIIDVRSSLEYDQGHIPGAINLPVDSIENASSVIFSKEAPVIVYCVSGARASKAAQILIENGYQNVYNLGAIVNWKGELERKSI